MKPAADNVSMGIAVAFGAAGVVVGALLGSIWSYDKPLLSILAFVGSIGAGLVIGVTLASKRFALKRAIVDSAKQREIAAENARLREQQAGMLTTPVTHEAKAAGRLSDAPSEGGVSVAPTKQKT